MDIKNDELADQSEKGDEQHDFRLNDALFSRDNVLKGMIELHSDQQRHDLAKDRLKHLVVERIEKINQQA